MVDKPYKMHVICETFGFGPIRHYYVMMDSTNYDLENCMCLIRCKFDTYGEALDFIDKKIQEYSDHEFIDREYACPWSQRFAEGD